MTAIVMAALTAVVVYWAHGMPLHVQGMVGTIMAYVSIPVICAGILGLVCTTFEDRKNVRRKDMAWGIDVILCGATFGLGAAILAAL